MPKLTLDNSFRFGSQKQTVSNLLTGTIETLLKELTKDWLQRFAREEQIQPDLIEWKKMLVKINEVLDDAMEKQTTNQFVKMWLAKLQILACDVDYLLDEFQTEAFHTDLKPANVLLDHDMEARISGFGLAKVFPDAHTHITTSDVVGTAGYIAPEYQQTLSITYMCDIYSFGVLLAGLVIGKLPSDDFFQHTEEMSLVKWMRNVMTSENPKRAINSKLLGNGYEEQMLLVLKIACFCTLDDSKERPNSKDVRCMLSQIQQ